MDGDNCVSDTLEAAGTASDASLASFTAASSSDASALTEFADFLALSRRLRLRWTPVFASGNEEDAVAASRAAAATVPPENSESPARALEAALGASPDAARAASIPDSRELLDNSPDTRGLR